MVAQEMPLLLGPIFHQVFSGGQRIGVVKQPDPQCRQGAELLPTAAVRPAHLEKALEAHLRKGRRQMVGPVVDVRPLTGQRVELTFHEIAEALAADVEIAALAVEEVHRHVEDVVDVALEAHAVLEHEVQHAAAVGVRVGPDMAAVALEAVWLALGEGRVGEQRRGNRLQRQRGAELAHHVGFVGEVEVDLHGAGPVHHVEAKAALLGHVGAHDVIAGLGHLRHLVAPPGGREAHAEHPGVHRLADLFDLVEVSVHFVAGLMQGFQRRAGEFDLAARLQRDVAAFLGQRDRLVAFEHRHPAAVFGQAFQEGADAALALVGQGLQVVPREGELLVLGADAPSVLRLAALFQIGDELAAIGDRLAFTLRRCGHGTCASSIGEIRFGRAFCRSR